MASSHNLLQPVLKFKLQERPASCLWLSLPFMYNIPATQKAWIIERRGLPASSLKLRNDWEVPNKLKQGEVLVKIQAAALNPA